MKKLLVSAAAVTVAMSSSQALAQALPPAVVAVVDLDRVTGDCNACRTAAAALKAQVAAVQTREQALSGPLQTEQKSIQAAIDALNGKEPDAALQARAKAWDAKRQQASQELATRQAQVQRNQQYVQKQVIDKLGPIYQQVMQRRGANIMVEVGNTVAAANSVDVTNDVLTALNTALPTISTSAPAQAQPQGR
jgi:Skp family chaperone for outer membrane proteins